MSCSGTEVDYSLRQLHKMLTIYFNTEIISSVNELTDSMKYS